MRFDPINPLLRTMAGTYKMYFFYDPIHISINFYANSMQSYGLKQMFVCIVTPYVVYDMTSLLWLCLLILCINSLFVYEKKSLNCSNCNEQVNIFSIRFFFHNVSQWRSQNGINFTLKQEKSKKNVPSIAFNKGVILKRKNLLKRKIFCIRWSLCIANIFPAYIPLRKPAYSNILKS